MGGLSGMASPYLEIISGFTMNHFTRIKSGVVPGPTMDKKDTPIIQKIPKA